MIIRPGSAVGVLGSGQLGRMFALAAHRLGYRVHTFSPEPESPAGRVADLEVVAPYEDLDAVRRFAAGVSVVTLEFENVPVAAAEAAAEVVPVRPRPAVLQATQHRVREKIFLGAAGLPLTPTVAVATADDLQRALERVGCPAVLKTADFGYDGKGQVTITSPDEAIAAWRRLSAREAVLEAFVDLEREVSVVAARGLDGAVVPFGVVENQHRRHILDLSVAPARVSADVAREALAIAVGVLEALDLVGVACVELFLARNGRLLVNEVAPRPHNSGHLTLDACVTSQFEQQLRAICGLPLGSPELLCPAAMANLLGDLWENGEPDWAAACAFAAVKLHLYGKAVARPRRKMGHLTALAASADEAERVAVAAREALTAFAP